MKGCGESVSTICVGKNTKTIYSTFLPLCYMLRCLVCIVVSCLVCIVVSCLVCIVVVVLCVLL